MVADLLVFAVLQKAHERDVWPGTAHHLHRPGGLRCRGFFAATSPAGTLSGAYWYAFGRRFFLLSTTVVPPPPVGGSERVRPLHCVHQRCVSCQAFHVRTLACTANDVATACIGGVPCFQPPVIFPWRKSARWRLILRRAIDASDRFRSLSRSRLRPRASLDACARGSRPLSLSNSCSHP